MLKYVILFTVFCFVQSQRPWHAGTSNRLPAVLPQYLDEQAAAQASQTGQAAQGPQVVQGALAPVTEETIVNRIDTGNTGITAPAFTTIRIPVDLPVDAHGDIDLINRIKTWPRDKQPFWYLNWQAIQAHRGDANNMAQPTQTQLNSRSFYDLFER